MISIISLLIFLAILSLLVFIHELGHFSTAKKFGIKVEEFGMGLPPRAWGKMFKGTLYSLNWLPLGGFVKINGEDLSEKIDPNDKTNFMNKPPWQRAVVLVAGVTMNFILALIIFYFLLGVNGFKSSPLMVLNDHKFVFADTIELPAIVTYMEEDSPAKLAGMQYGDSILSLEYESYKMEVKSVDDLRSFVKDKENKEIIVNVKNLATDELSSYKVTPKYYESIKQPALGVSLSDAIVLDYSRGAKPAFAGFAHSYNIMSYSFSVMGDLISSSFKEKSFEPVSQGVSGPVGIFGAVDSVVQNGGAKTLLTLLDLSALLSLSLAVMNLLPIPALDGGRLVFVFYEWITKRRVSAKIEAWAHNIGYLALIGLLIIITFKDVWKLFV